jgi:hypothetical protein
LQTTTRGGGERKEGGLEGGEEGAGIDHRVGGESRVCNKMHGKTRRRAPQICHSDVEFSDLVRAEEPYVLVEFHESNPEGPAGGGGELSMHRGPNIDNVQPDGKVAKLAQLGATLRVMANPIFF